jgi:hypothetical protein
VFYSEISKLPRATYLKIELAKNLAKKLSVSIFEP